MNDGPNVMFLLSEMAAAQAHLREILSEDHPGYAERPSDGRWSIVENLSHLLFAEQLHLGRYLVEPPPWSAIGLPPTGMQIQRRFQGLGQRASLASEVLGEWARIHESTKLLATNDSPQLRDRLERHLKHLNTHTRIIERLLRAQEKTSR